MRAIIYLIFFVLLTADLRGQAAVTGPCEIQDLAIEAALGDADAQYNLAVEFHKGEAIPQDLAKAAELWRMAVKGGVVSAYNNLGHLTYYGRGIKRNFAEGIRLWRVAATNGHAESQVHLAYAYSDGKFLKKDYVESYAWALVGQYSARLDDDLDMRKSVGAMASEVLENYNKLTVFQKARAERKAKRYISLYSKN